MKLLPIPLSPLAGAPPLGLWNSDLLWRYPSAPPSPLAELKTQLPSQLSSDPRIWGREEVVVFLRWTEREFDLPKFELDLFQMNGKALCLLTKNDLAERCPGAGDIIHNVLQLLIRDAQMLHRHLPNSPITPTNRFPLSPHSHPPTPNWNTLAPPENPFYASHLQHFLSSNSVTLSPAPSLDSQAGSPPGQQQETSSSMLSCQASSSSNENIKQNTSDSSEGRSSSSSGSDSARLVGTSSGTSSHQSDSEEEASGRSKHKIPKLLPPPLHHHKHLSVPISQSSHHQNHSPPITPSSSSSSSSNGSGKELTSLFHSVSDFKQNMQNIFFNGAMENLNYSGGGSGSNNASPSTPTTPGYLSIKREFFPDTPTEPSTNGRLLWDFLQQLLNDHQQRYSNYIAWKCRDTGVFKIVDPAGLAKLWGIQKNHLSMNYDKMSRALRYYYRVNILRKVQGERHCYQFLRNPTELKSIKNISLLRQSMTNQPAPTSTISNNNSPTQSSAANSLANLLPQTASSFQHLNLALSSTKVKDEYKTKAQFEDEKPTDLTTSNILERNYLPKSTECYPLIRNTNGLTTIQLLKQQQEQNNSSSISPSSSSPTSLSPPAHYFPSNMSKECEDEPTDLRKNYN